MDLLGIAILARHFGMSEIESWSFSRLTPLIKAPIHVANSSWDKNSILQVMENTEGLDYTHVMEHLADRRFANDMNTTVWLALSTLAPNSPLAYQTPLSSNLDTCVALYKDSSFSKTHPALFGYVFTIILSLGHRSSVWTKQLTREDRTVLYAAQVNLTSLDKDPDLDLSQLLQVPKSFLARDSPFWSYCRPQQYNAWDASFANLGTLNSSTPLEDICKLVLLPAYRQLFADSTRAYGHCFAGYCQRALDDIDAAVNNIFMGMYRKYEYFIE